jgi:SAM-dependent methyltransferase
VSVFDRHLVSAGSPASVEPEPAWSDVRAQIRDRVPGAQILLLGLVPGSAAEELTRLGAGQVEVRARLEELESDDRDGFDIVYCEGLLHRVPDPLSTLEALRGLMREQGTLVIGSMLVSDPERSEYLRFVPDRYGADSSWRFVPGRLAFRWLVLAAGFQIEGAFGEQDGPLEPFAVMRGYLKASAA